VEFLTRLMIQTVSTYLLQTEVVSLPVAMPDFDTKLY